MKKFKFDNIKHKFDNFNLITPVNIIQKNIIKGKVYLDYLENNLIKPDDKFVAIAIFQDDMITVICDSDRKKLFSKNTVSYDTDDGNFGIMYDDLLVHNNVLYIFETGDNREKIIRTLKIESIL